MFIDGGAYDGDTIEEIDMWTKGRFKHIYCFEPQKDKIESIEKKLYRWGDRVTLFKKGLWSDERVISFEDGTDTMSGHVSENGIKKVETTFLDKVISEKVSFIKMDIEGAEKEAGTASASEQRISSGRFCDMCLSTL